MPISGCAASTDDAGAEGHREFQDRGRRAVSTTNCWMLGQGVVRAEPLAELR